MLLWLTLTRMEPTLLEVLHEKGEVAGSIYIAGHLRRGRLDIHHEHAHSVAQAISSWASFSPGLTDVKTTRGFHHPDCGRFLCPPVYDWGNPA